MKKILALVMAVAMLLSCAAFAEEAEVKNPMEVDRAAEASLEKAWVDPETLTAEWTLVNAWIGEDFIDDYEVEGVEPGLIAVAPGTATMTITAILNECANDPSTGPVVDQASYIHAFTYCMEGKLVFAAHEDEAYTWLTHWNEWAYVVRGENDGDFNCGPAKISIRGEDELLYWTEITGVDYEDQEEMKYMFINTSGQLVLCYADKNIVSNAKNEKTIGIAYIFDKVVPETEEAAE